MQGLRTTVWPRWSATCSCVSVVTLCAVLSVSLVAVAGPATAASLLTVTVAPVPADVAATGPVTVSGSVANSDSVASPMSNVSLTLDTHTLSTPLTPASLQATCDVPGTTGRTADVVASSGVLTVSCPSTFSVNPSPATAAFAFHLAVTAPTDDSGTMGVTATVTDGMNTAPSSSPQTVTVHPSPVLGVTVPPAIDATPTSFSGSLTNIHGAAQSAARLYVVLSDGGGLSTLAPNQIHLTCAMAVNGGPATLPHEVVFGGSFNPGGPTGGQVSGFCPADSGPPDAGFMLAPEASDALSFQLSVDPAAPGGQLKVLFLLDALDSAHVPLTPALAATTTATMSVFPNPTIVTAPPAAVATATAPKIFSGSASNPAAGRDVGSPQVTLTLAGLAGLSPSDVDLTCDTGTGSGSVTAWSAGSGSITGTCPAVVALPPGSTRGLTFSLALHSTTATGTLRLSTSLTNGGASLATEGPHSISVVAGQSAPSCARTVLWSGGPGGDWKVPGNWDTNAVPGATDAVVIPAGSTITNVAGTLCNLLVDGGSDATTAPSLVGSGPVLVLGDTRLTGFTTYSSSGGAISSLTTNGALTTAGGTDLQLTDDQVALVVAGTAALGSPTMLHRPSGATGNPPTVTVTGTFRAAATTTFDRVGLALAANGTLDLHSGSLAVSGVSTSLWASGASVTDTSAGGGGVVSVGNGAGLVMTGTTTLGGKTTLRLAPGSLLSSGTAAAVLNGPATGTANLDWQGGMVTGNVTLGSTLMTVTTTASGQVLAAGSTLTNLGQLSLNPTSGSGAYDLEGDLENVGTLNLRPGITLLHTGAAGQGLINDSGATLRLEAPAQGFQSSAGAVLLNGVALHNAGTVVLPIGESLLVRNSAVSLTAGAVTGGGTPTAASGTSPPAPGTLQIGSGATLNVSGSVTLDQDAVLALDDTGPTAIAPLLVADPGATLTAPAAATATAGVFHWCVGTLSGPLVVAAFIRSEIGAGSEARACHNNSTANIDLAGGPDAVHVNALTLTGPASVNNATVVLEPHTRFAFGGTTTLGGAVTLGHTGVDVEDETILIDAAGALSTPSLQVPGTFATTRVTTSVPLINNGSFTTDSPFTSTAPLTNNGSAGIGAATTIRAQVVNTHNLSVFAATLDATGGYLQQLPDGATASTPPPVTQFSDAAGKLTTSDGATPAALAPVTLSQGGLVGGGTVEASAVIIGAGFIRPSAFNNGTATTLTINAPLTLSAASDLQFIVYEKTHDLLKVLQPATIIGQITGFTGTGYTPTYLATISGVITFPSHHGDFTSSKSGSTPPGLGWKPVPLVAAAMQVDLQLVDVAAPALGIASISAFTQLSSQRFTYAAVDNKTGVESYDVRWSRSASTGGIGGWTYPGPWQHTAATNQTLQGLADGYTYCFSVRVRDHRHNLSEWSQPLCTAKLLDDRAMLASGGWIHPGGLAAYYHGTYSRTKTAGATLKRTGTFTRVAFTAVKCRGCGNLLIYSGTTRIGSLSLNSTTTGLTSWVSPVLSSRTATVTLKVTTSGHPVTIDAFGLAR